MALVAGVAYIPSVAPSVPVPALQATHWQSAFDLLEGRKLDFGVESSDPHSSLDSLLARESEHPLIDPTGSLDGFFRSLEQAEANAGRNAENVTPVHILHYGDSPTTADLITADVRNRLQSRFGNAGHGFSLVAPPWVWYRHDGIRISASGWRTSSPALGLKGDGLYGLGGVSFEGDLEAYSEITLQDTSHDRVRVYFLKRPQGGTFTLAADNTVVGETDTHSEKVESGSQLYPIPAGTRKVRLQVVRGSARLFGFEFSKTRSGVLYSSLGLNGGNTEVLSRFMDPNHWGEQLRAARPSLVVINYGTNESVYKEYVAKQLEKELRKAVSRVREAVPDAAILVMSPMDRGVRDESGNITTAPTIPQVVEIQERVARDMRVAFFNTFKAMGGPGTMAKWYASNPRLVGGDYIHPMPAGAKLVGDLLYEGLEEQYRMFKLRELRKSLAPDAAPKGNRR
jgi:lysophospholipase L1-like esterase